MPLELSEDGTAPLMTDEGLDTRGGVLDTELAAGSAALPGRL